MFFRCSKKPADMARPLRVLLVSTPVAPLGSGHGGGVEQSVKNMALVLTQRGHRVQVVAPQGSKLPQCDLVRISGTLQPSAITATSAQHLRLPKNSVLENMWRYAHAQQNCFDVAVNFAYDHLPFECSLFFEKPIGHLVSMAAIQAPMIRMIGQQLKLFKNTVAMHSRTQALSFPHGKKAVVIYMGLDLEQFPFYSKAKPELAWTGRICKEKGLHYALAAAQLCGLPLNVMGVVEDRDYFKKLQARYSKIQLKYHGFIANTRLHHYLGSCQAFLFTPVWHGDGLPWVLAEALACGVPVISYRDGVQKEIITHGKTGYLVKRGSSTALAKAIQNVPRLNRRACRKSVEKTLSLTAFGQRAERWLLGLVE